MINLSVIPAPRNIPALLALFFYALAIVILILVWTQSTANSALSQAADDLAAQNEKISVALMAERRASADALAIDDLRALADRVTWYNHQIGTGAPPILAILDQLETSLPNDVRISALFYDRRGRYITFSLVSGAEESLLKSIEELQNSFAPMSVELERQVTLDSSRERLFQYDLRVSS